MTPSGKNNRSLRLVGKILLPVAICYLAIAAWAYFLQRRLMYFPDPAPVTTPKEPRFNGLENVALDTSDGLRVWGWFWPGRRPVTLVIFHGNGGNRWHRLEWIEDLHALGLGIFVLDYRGYGGSDGSPTEPGLYRDGEAAITWLRKRGESNLIYFGESLGCGVAVELALHHPPRALILQSGFSSAVDVAAGAYPFLPVRFMMKDRYDSTEKLARISAPVLVIHGDRDTIIAPRLGRALYEAAKDPKEWLLVPGADHNDLPWVGGRSYLEAIDRFVRKHVDGGIGSGPSAVVP